MKIRNIFIALALLAIGFYYGNHQFNKDNVSVVQAAVKDENIEKGPRNMYFTTFYLKDNENGKEYVVVYSNLDSGLAITPRLENDNR